jgi:hypothetical protein
MDEPEEPTMNCINVARQTLGAGKSEGIEEVSRRVVLDLRQSRLATIVQGRLAQQALVELEWLAQHDVQLPPSTLALMERLRQAKRDLERYQGVYAVQYTGGYEMFHVIDPPQEGK